MRQHVQEIWLLDDPDVETAMTDQETGLLLINPVTFWALPLAWRVFIVLHEAGHLAAGRSELAADDWAFAEYARRGYSLREAVNCLTYLLDTVRSEQGRQRVAAQLTRALNFDQNRIL